MNDLTPDMTLRPSLLEYFLEIATGQVLSDWLRDINQNSRGGVEERRERIRQNTKYLTMPAADFPGQTQNYLGPLDSEHLADICDRLADTTTGSKEQRYRRILREVRFREGWKLISTSVRQEEQVSASK
jgi:hypothetical protein